jgi:hypothetical protein
VYNVIQAKDHRLGVNIAAAQMAYVTNIAFLNRAVQCGVHYGYSFPDGASRLKQVAAGIQLPSVLATYVESIGQVSLASGVSVVPYVDEPHIWLTEHMISPASQLTAAGRQPPLDVWALDIEWIVQYNDATSRASRSGMNFRNVDNSSLLGRSEMLVSYKVTDDDLLLPSAPQIMSEAEAQLGAVYRFRNYDSWDDFGVNKELLFNAFIAIPFVESIMVSDLCVAAFKGANIVVE